MKWYCVHIHETYSKIQMKTRVVHSCDNEDRIYMQNSAAVALKAKNEFNSFVASLLKIFQ